MTSSFFFFFNDTATTEIYTLSLHDALPISRSARYRSRAPARRWPRALAARGQDRKSTRLNSSHGYISYAVFCLKKKKISFSALYDLPCIQPTFTSKSEFPDTVSLLSS